MRRPYDKMGIPSFYRHLLRKFPRLVSRGVGPAPEWLAIDWNCGMYHVLRSQPPFDTTNAAAWEAGFCRSIGDYLAEIVTRVRPTHGVVVSCDGVVCAAKRRQQRLRRFKGPWMAAAEAAVGLTSQGERWDQNALTPGSAFMAQLGDVLVAEGRRLGTRFGLDVRVSTTAEPGEGEHKLLRAMREVRPASCTIYGLDADLILLAMLLGHETGAQVRLLREAQEFETVVSRNMTVVDDEWRNLSVSGLVSAMFPGGAPVPDFVACMSLLGNDFLPRSLTMTVRGDGIPRLIGDLQRLVWSRGGSVVGADGRIQRRWLSALVKSWAGAEEEWMLGTCKDALRMASLPPRTDMDNPELEVWRSQPARWASVTRLLDPYGPLRLRRGWRDMYRQEWHAGSATEYCAGLAWIWDYYSGRAVDYGWCFGPHLPPLWSDVAAELASNTDVNLESPPVTWPTPLPEWAHLLSVLPADSVERLLPVSCRRWMARAPWYWPASWSLFDVGRTQMWECEPVIPLIPEGVVRSWVSVDKLDAARAHKPDTH